MCHDTIGAQWNIADVKRKNVGRSTLSSWAQKLVVCLTEWQELLALLLA